MMWKIAYRSSVSASVHERRPVSSLWRDQKETGEAAPVRAFAGPLSWTEEESEEAAPVRAFTGPLSWTEDVIACHLRFTDEYFLQRERKNFEEDRVNSLEMLDNLVALAAHDQRDQPPAVLAVNDAEAGEGESHFPLILKDALDLLDAELHVREVFGQKQTAAVQKTDVVADVLELAEIVRRDDGRKAASGHFLGEEALRALAHDGVESVKCLVAEQVIRIRRNSADDRELLLHALRVV